MFGFSKAIVFQYPSGKWGFVGLVHAKLSYLGTDEELAKASAAGCFQFLKRRVFDTEQAAKDGYKEVMGVEYQD